MRVWTAVLAIVVPSGALAAPPSVPDLDTIFGRCGGIVFNTGLPASIPVGNSVDPEGDPIALQVQAFEAIGPVVPLIDVTVPQDPAGSRTDVPIDLSALAENGSFAFRARACDPGECSAWSGLCPFWINLVNSAPSALEIFEPTEGMRFPHGTTFVTVSAGGSTDPDFVVPGSTLDIAWCADRDATFPSCANGTERNWQLTALFGDADGTTFEVTGLADGEVWFVKACALDELDLCGPLDQIEFSVEDTPPGSCTRVVCDSDQVCDPSTGLCVASEPPPSHEQGGCGCTTSNSPAGFWFVSLLALAWRRR